MCTSLRTGRLTGLEAKGSMHFSRNEKDALGKAGEIGKGFTV